MPNKQPPDLDSSALNWSSSICSIVGLIAVLALQPLQLDDNTLLFWWITTVLIAIAAVSVCFTPPSLPLRFIFAIVFVAQMPPFTWAWSEIHERDTEISLGHLMPEEKERELNELESENAHLRTQHRQSLLFWQAIAHLSGMAFSMVACTAAGQQRVRIVYEAS